VPFCHSSVLIEKYRDRYASDAKLFRNSVFPSDRKGDLAGPYELPDIVITAKNKDADELNALAAVCLTCLLKFRSLLLALRSPVSADVYHHRSLVCCLVFDYVSVNGLEAEICDSFSGIRKANKENYCCNSP
jgi:hypothetical protein